MANIDYMLLAVRDPLTSGDLYARILGREPVEKASTFVMFVLPNGLKLGLWKADEIVPAAKAPGGVELSLTMPDAAALSALREEWAGYGLSILQEPTQMDFGLTFTAEDSDGHRLRPFVPGM
jgi:catechol 2,3-dioxygenase-like lactoylglutathione lyase family enzyme